MMQSEIDSPLGLIAGNGNFPIEFARNVRAKGRRIVAVAHIGETDQALEKEVSKCIWLKVGQLGKVISFLKKSRADEVAFVGGIVKPRLFGGFKLDMKGLLMLAKLRSFNDDVLLKGVAAEIEKNGIKVVAASDYLQSSIPNTGLLTRRKITTEEHENAVIGWHTAVGVGALDVGQTIVTNQKVVVAVEAVEGTDACLKRAGQLSGKGCVVVKISKPGQDLRFDMPSIGEDTISAMSAIGATALVIESNKTLILHPDEVVHKANVANISIVAVEKIEDLTDYMI